MNENWCCKHLPGFVECCEVLAALTNLQWIQLFVCILDIHLQKISKGEGNYEHLAASRKLKIIQGWDIQVRFWVDAWYLPKDELLEREMILEREYTHVIEDIMKPDCLRIDTPATKMSTYLSS